MTPRRLTRRTLLVDLGRSTLAVAVLGVATAACGDDEPATDVADGEEGAAGDGGAGDGGATEDEGAAAPADDGVDTGEAGELRWARASFGFVSAYVVVRDGEALLFDTGTGGVGAVGDALAAAGVGWSDLSTVLVSHRHDDHVGGVEGVAAEAPDALFLAGVPDLDVFRDRVRRAEPVADGDRVMDLRVVATPGHTEGHVCAFDPASGLLLAGDAIVNGVAIGGTTGEGIEVSPPAFTADVTAATASVRTLATLPVDVILFGHGEPATENAGTQLVELAESV